jgi:hypothetical protein
MVKWSSNPAAICAVDALPTRSQTTFDDVVAAIDARAARVGLSRAEYLRRALGRERTQAPDSEAVRVSDLRRFADLASRSR